MLSVIFEQAGQGNFSFFILTVNVIQLFLSGLIIYLTARR